MRMCTKICLELKKLPWSLTMSSCHIHCLEEPTLKPFEVPKKEFFTTYIYLFFYTFACVGAHTFTFKDLCSTLGTYPISQKQSLKLSWYKWKLGHGMIAALSCSILPLISDFTEKFCRSFDLLCAKDKSCIHIPIAHYLEQTL